MNLETAKEIKRKLNAGTPSKLFNSRPIDREFFGRFELALELLTNLEENPTAPAASMLEHIKMSLESTLGVYGKALQENTGINEDQTN